MRNFSQWDEFKGNRWKEKISVRDFVRDNYTPYDGDESFPGRTDRSNQQALGRTSGASESRTCKQAAFWTWRQRLCPALTAYGPGYIDENMKDLETGSRTSDRQTVKTCIHALRRHQDGRAGMQNCTDTKLNPQNCMIFLPNITKHTTRRVFDIYTPEMKVARHNKIITGLPDTYGRGRIVGDYRRVALYGIDSLIEAETGRLSQQPTDTGMHAWMIIRLREEIADQIRALKGMKEMAAVYGYDISQPAKNAKEAVQWLYFGYLAAIKTQNGAAMSVGRISTFLDIYIERDMQKGILTEEEAQELIDHMVMKFRMVKFARIPSYNQLFSGDPVWATLEVAGLGMDGRHMVTKNDYRFLHTLENMGPAPEPNLTVLYSSHLPEHFKKYAANISVNYQLYPV